MQTQSISTNNVQQKDSFLRRALQANALFSLATGTAFVVASGSIARFMGAEVPSALVLIVGLGLLPFGYIVYRLTAQAAISSGAARSVTLMDVSWVIGSFLLLLLGWSLFTVAGRWFIGLQAEAVATFALLQTMGLRRLKK
jgi:hypothetical protein